MNAPPSRTRTREGLPWSRDDYVLVLEFAQRRGSMPLATDPEWHELADIMQRSPAAVMEVTGALSSTGRRGGDEPVEVVEELRNQPEALALEAIVARQRLRTLSETPVNIPGEGSGPREQTASALRIELLGPSEENERLRERPTTRYTCGILWPEGTEIDPEQNEAPLPGDDEEDSAGFEISVPLVQTLNPSSIGLSAMVDQNEYQLLVEVEWAEYHREESTEAPDDAAGPRHMWARMPVRPEPVRISLRGPRADRHPVSADRLVFVEWLIRARAREDTVAVSAFLVNRRPRPQGGIEREEAALFQPRVLIRGVEGRAIILGRHPEPAAGEGVDPDERANRLLFREESEFGVGHGAAADWDRDPGSADRALRVWTDVLPFNRVPAMVPYEDIPGLELDMGRLAELADAEQIQEHLRPLIDAYASWVKRLEEALPSLRESDRRQAEHHIAGCAETLNRIAAGIRFIEEDSQARRAFLLMNKAMRLQRSHTDWAAGFRKTGARSADSPMLHGRWRAFQLAFILQCVGSCANPNHPEREIADLLWFPTGGGKTEAYLGLATFTAVLRRLRHQESSHHGAGVCVLMRYTLRLLTVQQFQRAVTLVCALEVLRRDETDLGNLPFTVGVWVGRGTTPNTFDESDRALTQLVQGQEPEAGSPVQLLSCPWCGESLNARNGYRTVRAKMRTLIGCPRRECEFSFDSRPDGIPALVVDEEIYHCLPTMLIGTVDKFARLPWQGEAQALFGLVTRQCPRHGFVAPAEDHPDRHNARNAMPAVAVSRVECLLPPELIIQDELHLISGPLGSMVGLYEAGIDWLSSRRGEGAPLPPKVVASTATIRRASDQVWPSLPMWSETP